MQTISKPAFILVLAGLLPLMAAGQSYPSTIDFTDVGAAFPGGVGHDDTNTGADDALILDVQTAGFSFVMLDPPFGDNYSGDNHFHVVGGSSSGNSSNGTPYIGVHIDTTCCMSVLMSPVGGGTFSLNAVDLAEFLSPSPFDAALFVRVTGVGGGAPQTELPLDWISDGPGGADDFQRFVFGSEWTGLTAVRFTGVTGSCCSRISYGLDNIVVNEVPEPATAILVFGGAAAFASRKLRHPSIRARARLQDEERRGRFGFHNRM